MKPSCHSPRTRTATGQQQRGATLVVALVFLIALTLLGIASMGGNTLQQRMAYSVGESNRAFQGAETGIVNGETWLDNQILQPVPDCPESDAATCGDSLSIWPGRPPDPTQLEVTIANLRTPNWWINQGRPVGWRYEVGALIGPIAGQEYRVGGVAVATNSNNYPRYVVEVLGPDPSGSVTTGASSKVPTLWYYQISSRGGGSLASGPSTITQSVYTRVY